MGLLGKDSITITDITDVNPIRLDLASSQPIYQTKRASGYEPDYKNNPLIITPYLYFGQEEVNREKYINKITFYINGVEVVNTKTIYVESTELHIEENLNQNTKIEAVIEKITDERTKVEYERVSENLSFYLLSYDSSGYTAFIDSEDGRYDFSTSNSGSITLRAHLYLGNTEVSANYTWKKSSDPDNKIGTRKELTIERGDIYSHENFICEITYEGVSYIATCTIDDRTDIYSGAIISDTSLVMTPILNTANLTCKIYRNGQEVTSDSIIYEWLYYTNNSTTGEEIGKTKNISISLGSEKNPPKDSFSLYCIATIDNKYKVVSYLPISYSVSYTPILTPKTIFIPSNNDGSYQGEDEVIEKTLTFFLQGEDGAPIEADLTSFSISGSEGIIIGDFNVENKKYNIPFSINVSNFNNYDVSELFELSYTYKGHSFNEEFYIVKSIQGNDGIDGIDYSSYSLILSNDYHRFAGEQVYAIKDQEVSTNIQFFKGNEELDIKTLKINDKTLTIEEQEISGLTGLKVKINKALPEKDIQIIFKTKQNELKEGGSIAIEAIVMLNGKEKSFITMFNYDINYEGNSYFLSFENGTSISYVPSKNSFNPKELNFYTYYRQNGLGENRAYTDGKVFVSVDGGTKENLTENNKYYYSYEIQNNPKNNITFYLYNSMASDSDPEDAYLMDRETIPILTSLEGAEIGGDNLLRFTRTLQWDIQNSNKDIISINKGADTSIANFNFNTLTGDTSGSNKVCVLVSPKIYIEKELEDKTFCLSFYFKNDSEKYFGEEPFIDGNIHASIYAYDKNGSQLEAKSILYISNTNSNNAKVENEEIIEKGKWVRVYQTFGLNIFNKINDLSSVKYYKIKIMGVINSNINENDFTYNFSIKKPKLEVGNTLTAWSMATNDILFENLNVDLENLNSLSLIDALNNQIDMLKATNTNVDTIKGNIADGKFSFSINEIDGSTINFTSLSDFSSYLNGNINQIIDDKTSQYDSVSNKLETLITENGEFFKIRNNIKLGFDDKDNLEPYLLFEVSGKGKTNSMRLTTKKLGFYSGANELAYFGSNSMTIKRARVSEGYYLGTNDTGYLVMKTTPQGCAFVWEDKFEE